MCLKTRKSCESSLRNCTAIEHLVILEMKSDNTRKSLLILDKVLDMHCFKGANYKKHIFFERLSNVKRLKPNFKCFLFTRQKMSPKHFADH